MKHVLSVVSVSILLFSQAVFGEKSYVGKIDSFNYGSSKIVIDDSVFHLQLDTVVKNSRGNVVNRTALKKGHKVTFLAAWDVNRMVISDISLLPASK